MFIFKRGDTTIQVAEPKRRKRTRNRVKEGTAEVNSIISEDAMPQSSTSKNPCCQTVIDEIQSLRLKYEAFAADFELLRQEVRTMGTSMVDEYAVQQIVLQVLRSKQPACHERDKLIITKSEPPLPTSQPASPIETIELELQQIVEESESESEVRSQRSKHQSESDDRNTDSSDSDSEYQQTSDDESRSSKIESNLRSHTPVTEFDYRPKSQRMAVRIRNSVSPSPSHSQTEILGSDPITSNEYEHRADVLRRKPNPNLYVESETINEADVRSLAIENYNNNVPTIPVIRLKTRAEVKPQRLYQSEAERKQIKCEKRRLKRNECKTFECSNCDDAFHSQYELTRHERKHTKEKPFECTACQKKFSQKHHLTRHVASKHRKSYTPISDRQGRVT